MTTTFTYYANATLSGGNLVATGTATTGWAGSADALAFHDGGQYYWECTFTTKTSSSTGCGVSLINIGSTTAASTGKTLAEGDGSVYQTGATLGAFGAAISSGDIVCVAVDLTRRLFWARKAAGNWNNSASANPVTGVGGYSLALNDYIAPCVTVCAIGDKITANFGGSAYTYTPPSGFGNWPSPSGETNNVLVSQAVLEVFNSPPSVMRVTQAALEVWWAYVNYGDIAVTETSDTFAATGTIIMPVISGDMAVTEVPDAFAVSGSVIDAVTGTGVIVELPDIFSASGAVLSGISGDIAIIENPDVFAAYDEFSISGEMAVTEDPDVFFAKSPNAAILSETIGIKSSVQRIWFARSTISSTIGIGASITPNWFQSAVIDEIIQIQHSLLAGSTYDVLMQDQALIRDALFHAMPVTLYETIGIRAMQRAVIGVLIVDGLRLRSAVSGSALYYRVIAEAIGLRSALGRFVGASLSQGIGVHAALSRMYVSRPVMTEGVSIASVLGRSLLFSYTMPEGVELKEQDVLNAIYTQTYSEGVQINASYIEPSGAVTTWAVNMRSGAVSEYQNYEFNSFAKFRNKYLAASHDGLYELNGDTDDGEAIISDIAGGFAQFGESHFASLKAVYLAVRGGGNFVFRLVEGDGTTRDYAVSAKDMRTTRIDLGKGLRTRYFAYELISTGQDFDLDNLEFVPIILQRRV